MTKAKFMVLASALTMLTALSIPLAAAPRYQYEDLGTLGGNLSGARAINDLGQVVGVAKNAAGQDRAFLKNPGSPMEDWGPWREAARLMPSMPAARWWVLRIMRETAGAS